MDDVCKLISQIPAKDEIGQSLPVETSREVLCEIGDITRAEFSSASQSGLKPELKIKTFFLNYQNEKIVEYNGERYSIYRTFRNGDDIELYAGSKAGII